MSYEPDLALLYLVSLLDAAPPIAAGGVWEDNPPADTPYPFVQIAWMAAHNVRPAINRAKVRLWSSTVWRVFAVAVVGETDIALPAIAADIDSRLSGKTGAVDDGFVYEITNDAPWRRSFSGEGVIYREAGGVYRVVIQSPVGGTFATP